MSIELHMPCIHEAFESIAKCAPDNTALKLGKCSLSYGQLNRRANFLANHLESIGVTKGDVVALAMPPSFEMIVSMLAVLKSGAAYLPVDENNPGVYILTCLGQAKVDFLISSTKHTKELCVGGRVNVKTEEIPLFCSESDTSPNIRTNPNDKAYVMFTSGSSGGPKGVVVPHRAVNRLVVSSNFIDINCSDSILFFSPASFDASTFEIWGALLNGATLAIYSGSIFDPNLFKKEICQYNITILWLTAALFHLIADRYMTAISSIAVLLAGGDILIPRYVNRVLDEIPNITIINGYGPTENTTFTCCHRMSCVNRPSSIVPIGRPIRGTQVHVLDENLRPVLEGESGELYASGLGVALGYLTNEKYDNSFFRNNDISDGLVYRTGDLVRTNSNGELEFVGRKDFQVKIRGYRVSLEEIESHIANLNLVREVAAFLKFNDLGEQLLVAYVEEENGGELNSAKMKTELSLSVPRHMVPDRIVIGTNLPINKNGKLDRRKIELEICR